MTESSGYLETRYSTKISFHFFNILASPVDLMFWTVPLIWYFLSRTRRIGDKIEEKAVYQFLTNEELEAIQKVILSYHIYIYVIMGILNGAGFV